MRSEFERLLRELGAARSLRSAHGVMQISLLTDLTDEQRQQLWASFPRKFRAKGDNTVVLESIQHLQVLNVSSGQASSWSKTTPWRDNPWQLIQVATSQALHRIAAVSTCPQAEILQHYGIAAAIGPSPHKAWLQVIQISQGERPPAAAQALAVAHRCLLAAWTTMQRQSQPTADMLRDALQRVLKELGASPTQDMLAEVTRLSRLTPAQAAEKLATSQSTLRLAFPEILAIICLHDYLANPEKAVIWHGRMQAEWAAPAG